MIDILITSIIYLVNTEQKAAALALSKGGWEGWLQCELWLHLVMNSITVERELAYPGMRLRCDLVVGDSQPRIWTEIKAFGIFREDEQFIEVIRQDALKLNSVPVGDTALLVVVVPKTAVGHVVQQLKTVWLGFRHEDAETVGIFYLSTR